MMRRQILGLMGVLVALALLPLVVRAHAGLVSAEPLAGEEIDESPAEVRLVFSEPIGPESQIVLFGEGFQRVDGVVSAQPPDDPTLLIATVPPLADGVYTVQYDVVSADGHPISGTYTFSLEANSAEGRSIPYLLIGIVVGTIVVSLLRRRDYER